MNVTATLFITFHATALTLHQCLKFGAVVCKLVYENVHNFSFPRSLSSFYYSLLLSLLKALSFSSFLLSMLHLYNCPLPYLKPAEFLGWSNPHWITSFTTSTPPPALSSLLSPSLHAGGVRTEVKSCRAELPGHLPKTLADQKTQFSPHLSLSVSVSSPTFSPLLWCAKCFSASQFSVFSTAPIAHLVSTLPPAHHLCFSTFISLRYLFLHM